MIKSMSTMLALLLLLTGCAGIIHGTSQSLTFTSEPSGADVLIDGQMMGATPLTVSLKKNKYQTVMIQKTGYRTISRPIDKAYDSIALLNVFWDSSTTDMISGAAYEYAPNSYYFKLEAEVK